MLIIGKILLLVVCCCAGLIRSVDSCTGIGHTIRDFSSCINTPCSPQQFGKVKTYAFIHPRRIDDRQTHPISLTRSSVVIPPLPNRFGHDRLSRNRNTCTKNHHHQLFFAKSKLLEETNNEATLSDDESIDNNTNKAVDIKQSVLSPGNASSDNTTSDTADEAIDTTSIPKEFLPILFLCFLVTFLSALDRVAMSIAILPMATEFGYTETIKGQISSAVSYGYGLAILPIGLAVSIISPRLLMMLGVSMWSLATLGTPLMAELSSSNAGGIDMVKDATTTFLLPLLLMRGVMGGAEAVVLPTMQRILSNWVPAEKKATALAIVISGFQLGTVFAYLISPAVLDFMSGLDGGPADMAGWRGMFYLYGCAGLVWLLPWNIIAKDKAVEVDVNDDCEETFVNSMMEDDASLVLNDCIIEDEPATTKLQEVETVLQAAPWTEFAMSPGVWGMMLAHAAKNFELYNLLAWTPTFFSQQYGLNVKESALFSVAPSICGMVGSLTAGIAADFILVRYLGNDEADSEEAIQKRTQIRKLFQSIALLGPATCLYLLSNLPDDTTTAQILLGGAVGLQAFDAAGFGAATQEKAGERWAGLLYSLTSLPGVLVGSVSVSVTGRLLDAMETREAGWTAVFQLNSAICVAGAICFLFLYDSKREFE